MKGSGQDNGGTGESGAGWVMSNWLCLEEKGTCWAKT